MDATEITQDEATIISPQSVNLDKDDVTLVVNGSGKDKAEATKAALRSAIEQAYGVFVS